MYKTVALGKILIGETKRAYDAWKLEGLQYDRLLAKLRDYARSKRLDGEARVGKQAVDINTCQQDGGQEESQGDKGEEDGDSLNAVNAKCYVCGKKGHVAPNCP